MKFIVSKEESGTKLNQFLKTKLPHLSLRAIKSLIEKNSCSVNQRVERFASYEVGVGDVVDLQLEIMENKVKAEKKFAKSRILFEDADLLIYNKPADLASDDPDFISFIQQFVPKTLYLGHRLDKETTGALIIAKNKKMAEAIHFLFRDRLMVKCYIAIVDGIPSSHAGVIDSPLTPLKAYQGQTMWGVHPSGLPSLTEWIKEESWNDASLLRCYPKTGRTHQIRVHLASIGHPILGDYQYGRNFKCSYKPNRILLHAEWIEFAHPITNKTLKVQAPIPSDFIIRGDV